MVKVTGGSNKRVSLAALIAIKHGHRPRLIYRVLKNRQRRGDQRKGSPGPTTPTCLTPRTSSSPSR